MPAASRNLHVKYLLVGGGLAASAAAEAIRDRDAAGSMLVAGQEILRPYHRPPLSKTFLRGELAKGDLLAQPVGWFPQHGTQLVTGRRATTLDAGRQRVGFDDGSTVQYDELLLAFGGMVAPLEIPGAGLPGLYYLRTLGDAESLVARAKTAVIEGRPQPNGRGRAVVIGGGTLGVETAASLRQRGLWVDLVMKDQRPWQNAAGETAGRWIASLLESEGVNVHANNPPAKLLGDGRVQRVELAGGETLQCDFAVACVGMRVDRRLLGNTSISVAAAVMCDAYGRAGADGGVSHVWAAGDCAAIFDRRFGKNLPGGHWDVARLAGRLVGGNMAAAAAGEALVAWDELPGVHSEIFGRDVYAWGAARLIDRRLVRGGGSAFAEIGVDLQGEICHVLVVGRDGEHAALRNLVRDRASVEGREENLRDPEIAL